MASCRRLVFEIFIYFIFELSEAIICLVKTTGKENLPALKMMKLRIGAGACSTLIHFTSRVLCDAAPLFQTIIWLGSLVSGD